jgi:hypothetical protein
LVAYFHEEEDVLSATRAARESGYRIHDVYTPYAVHGLDEAMGIGRSRLPWVCLAGGILGLGFACWMQIWTSAVSWPLNVGGKAPNSFPAFIPVAFELTVLFAALITVSALFVRARFFPGRALRVLPGVTNDRFALALLMERDDFDEKAARTLCEGHGADEVTRLEVAP